MIYHTLMIDNRIVIVPESPRMVYNKEGYLIPDPTEWTYKELKSKGARSIAAPIVAESWKEARGAVDHVVSFGV